jgi:nitronate monooxygenase
MAPYPLQGKIMGLLKAYPATATSTSELKAFWAGQSASLIKHKDANVLLEKLVSELN